MNFHYFFRRLLRKPTCIKHASARLGSRARIINMGGPDERIRIGLQTVVNGELLVFAHGGQIQIGAWCYVGEGSRLWAGAHIVIGDRVMIAHGVNIFDNLTHPLDAARRHAHFRTITTRGHPLHIDLGERPVRIHDDAWIGAGAMVLRGVTVGQGAIVAAGAVVTHDVAPWCIVAGNPARIVRQINPGRETSATPA